MAKRIFIHHSKSNHCQSVNPQFGTQFGTWISHFGHMDFSNSCFEFLHSCTLQLSQVDLKWSCRLIDNLMGCIFEPAPYSHGEFVMYMPKIDFWLIFFLAEVKISSRSLLKTLSPTRSVLPELCSPNVRPQIDCVQSVFLASPLSYLFQVTVLQLAVIIREVSVGLTLGI